MKCSFKQCSPREEKKTKKNHKPPNNPLRDFKDLLVSPQGTSVCFQRMLAQSIQKGMWTLGKLLKACLCHSVYSCVTQIYKAWRLATDRRDGW